MINKTYNVDDAYLVINGHKIEPVKQEDLSPVVLTATENSAFVPDAITNAAPCGFHQIKEENGSKFGYFADESGNIWGVEVRPGYKGK